MHPDPAGKLGRGNAGFELLEVADDLRLGKARFAHIVDLLTGFLAPESTAILGLVLAG
jgi:hypothetical protein